MTAPYKTHYRVMRNLVDRFGKLKTRWLVDELAALTPLRTIAAELGVSHERVRQWSVQLGQRVTSWTPYEQTTRFLIPRKTLPPHEQ